LFGDGGAHWFGGNGRNVQGWLLVIGESVLEGVGSHGMKICGRKDGDCSDENVHGILPKEKGTNVDGRYYRAERKMYVMEQI
jgi:hypothetical protein